MFYLVTQTPGGSRLVDYAGHAATLIPLIEVLSKDNPDSTPAVFNDEVMESGFLLDGFGIPVLDAAGYLIQVTDL